jgi:hypothetical protein
MKPLYWKFLLIVGAMIVGASLVVPKALRKNASLGGDNSSQTLFLPNLNQATSFGTTPTQGEDAIVTFGKAKYLSAIYKTRFSKSNLAIAIRFMIAGNAPRYSLNAGTKPTNSRVID